MSHTILSAFVAGALATAPMNPDEVSWDPEEKAEPDLRDPAEKGDAPAANPDDLQTPGELETTPEGEDRLDDTKARQESERKAKELEASDVEAPDPVAEPPSPRPVDYASHEESRRIRIAGIATMTAGGALSVTGLTLVITFFTRGNGFASDLDDAIERSNDNCFDDPGSQACRQAEIDADNARQMGRTANSRALIGVGITVGGIIALVAGGATYAHGTRRDRDRERLSILPTRDGLTMSGRF